MAKIGRNRRGRRQPASCCFGFSWAELPCASAGDKSGRRTGSPARRSSRWGRLAPAVNSVDKSERPAAVLWYRRSWEQVGWKGFDGDDHEIVDWMAKRKGIDETNAMVCSPSAKDERRLRKSSLELRSHRSWGRWRSRRQIRVIAHHDVELDDGNSRVVSLCTGSSRSRRKFAGI
jgi:hypothetical protein